MFFSNINLWSVLVAAVAAFVVGYVWYSPAVFGKQWVKASGMTDESMKGKKEGMAKKLLLSFICTVVTAYIAAVLYHSLYITSGTQLLALVFAVWLGFTAATKSGNIIFARESLTVYLINIGHDLVALITMFFVISLFK
ncbi:MAG TPA: DUF1761 domain-containing protein [Candidatus Paceibacterota bacterium]|nr:DUF1761 domain-containing protein [Candidatus Paceibacterota bacterium]